MERLREPPEQALVIKIDPVEELLKEYPELGAFGTEWVRKWLDLRDRLVEIAKVLRRFPWMVEVVRQRPVSILHPYMVEVYVTRDGSEACLSLNPPKAFCAQKGAVKEVRIELAFIGSSRTRAHCGRCTAPRDYWPTPRRPGNT